jgi:hypothetical protein
VTKSSNLSAERSLALERASHGRRDSVVSDSTAQRQDEETRLPDSRQSGSERFEDWCTDVEEGHEIEEAVKCS